MSLSCAHLFDGERGWLAAIDHASRWSSRRACRRHQPSREFLMGSWSSRIGVRTVKDFAWSLRRLLPCRATVAAAIGVGVLFGATTALAAPLGSPNAVQPGDTATSIAAQSGVSVDDLVVANPGLDLDRLVVGETLVVPPPANAAPARSAEPPTRRLPQTVHIPSFDVTPDGVVQRTMIPAPDVLHPIYRSQFDGSMWAGSNCGPTSLAMALGALGIQTDEISLRLLANAQMRDSSPDNGTTWASLAYAAEQRGATPIGVMSGRSPRRWTLTNLTAQLNAGRPVLLLVRYWDLPDHLTSTYGGDHYIVALGVDGDGNIVIDDPASKNGPYRTLAPNQLLAAWGDTSEGINDSAMALTR
jgi:LysM repeat protein